MSKCFDHDAPFLDTHRHFCPAIEISRKLPIACGGLELKKSILKNKRLGLAAYVFELLDFRQKSVWSPMSKIKGNRMHNFEFTMHQNCAFDSPCFFLHMGHKIHFVCNHTLDTCMQVQLYLNSCIHLFSVLILYIYIFI